MRVLRKILFKVGRFGYCNAEITEDDEGWKVIRVLDDIRGVFTKNQDGTYLFSYNEKENEKDIIDINKLKLKKLLED